MKNILIFFVAILYLAACKEDEEMLSGDITGVINVYDQGRKLLPEQAGIEVSLVSGNGIIDSTVTDLQGKYLLKNVNYGRYRLNFEKGGFMQTWDSRDVFHVGGKIPSIANFYLYEVPYYELSIDSIRCSRVNLYELDVYLKVDGDTLPPSDELGFFEMIGFAGSSPNVSKDEYISRVKGFLRMPQPAFEKGGRVYGRVILYDENFDQLKSGTIYIRFYPLAMGQGYWIHEYFTGALGKPSNVTGFVWEN